jgi:hypothetical protein
MFAALAVFVLVVGWPCPFRAIVGAPCPTCGLTRATRLVLHAEFGAATRMHPLVWIVDPFVGAWLTSEIVGYLRKGRWGVSSEIPAARLMVSAVAVLLVVVWVARFLGALGGPVPA